MNHIQFPSQQIGEFSITAISDGYLSASLDLLSNIDLIDASKLQQNAGARIVIIRFALARLAAVFPWFAL